MAATIFTYNAWALNIARAQELPGSISVSLHTSAYTPNQDTHIVFADVTNQLATANGYTSGGQALSSITWARSAAVATLDAADVTWNVITANLVCRYAVLRAVGTFNSLVDPLIAYILLDNAPADVTVTPGNPLTLQWNASGIQTVTRVT